MAIKYGCKPGDKVHVLIVEFGAVPVDVQVFCNEIDAKKTYNKFIKKHFRSHKNFDEQHGYTDKSDIYRFITTLDFKKRRR